MKLTNKRIKKMATFKKLQNKFATKEQAKRQDVLVWTNDFWKACRWFFEKGKKEAKVVTTFPRSYWQSIEELTEGHGEVLGRCGNEFSLIVKESYDNGGDSIVDIETGNFSDAREFMVIPKNNREGIEVTYRAKGLVLGITWEGIEGIYPSARMNGVHLECLGVRELLSKATSYLQDSIGLTGTGDFSKQLGAILIITKSTTIQVNGKPFVNTEVSRELIGELSTEQMELLDEEMGW